MKMQLLWQGWSDLSPGAVHDLLRLRSEVFVVEQDCVFVDIDGLDPHCEHLLARDTHGLLAGALRLLPPRLKSAHAGIGRLVVAPPARGTRLARTLMQTALARCAERHPGQRVAIGAQRHLRRFYESLGFTAVGEAYLEDGIPHVDMLRDADILPR
jgi:ElaA protein